MGGRPRPPYVLEGALQPPVGMGKRGMNEGRREEKGERKGDGNVIDFNANI